MLCFLNPLRFSLMRSVIYWFFVVLSNFVFSNVSSAASASSASDGSRKRQRTVTVSDSNAIKYARHTRFEFDFMSERPHSRPLYSHQEVLNIFKSSDMKKVRSIFYLSHATDLDLSDNFDFWTSVIQGKNYSGLKYVLEKQFRTSSFHRIIFEIAIKEGATSLVKFMLHNCLIFLEDDNLSFVTLAAENSRYKILGLMASFGFNPNSHAFYVDPVPLIHFAVQSENIPLIKALLKFRHLDINARDGLGNTVLHKVRSAEIIELLLKKNADPFLTNLLGKDSIQWAISDERFDIIMMYLPTLNARLKHFIDTNEIRKVFVLNHKFTIVVSRESILEESFCILNTNNDWFKFIFQGFQFKFKGEGGIDQGGLTREWMSLIIERFFVPRFQDESELELALDTVFYNSPFENVDENNTLFKISSKFTGPPQVYALIGSVMAKAILEKIPLRVKMAPSLLKLILGDSLTFDDLKDDDPTIHRSLLYLLDPSYDFVGARHYLPNDESVQVTSETVHQFLDETAHENMYGKYSKAIDQLIRGFRSILNAKTLKMYFTWQDLQSLLAGEDTVDRVALRSFITIRNDYWKANASMFWEAIDFLSNEELIKLIQFITGINGLPFGGVSGFSKKISIFDSNRRFIKASTCSFALNLPISIKNVDVLLNSLRLGIASSSEFFEEGFCC
jgi:hypothetical protein